MPVSACSMLTSKQATTLRDLAINSLIFDADGKVIGGPRDFDHADIEDALDALDSIGTMGDLAADLIAAGEALWAEQERDSGESPSVVWAGHDNGALAIYTRGDRRFELLIALAGQQHPPTEVTGPEIMNVVKIKAAKRSRVCMFTNVVHAAVGFSQITRHTMSGSELSVMSLGEETHLPGGASIVRTSEGWELWKDGAP